jgi:hypothetical protein
MKYKTDTLIVIEGDEFELPEGAIVIEATSYQSRSADTEEYSTVFILNIMFPIEGG